MVHLWLYNGSIMDISWLYNGYIMVNKINGYSVVIMVISTGYIYSIMIIFNQINPKNDHILPYIPWLLTYITYFANIPFTVYIYNNIFKIIYIPSGYLT